MQGVVVVCVCRDGRFTHRVFQYAAVECCGCQLPMQSMYLRGVTMYKVACRRATQRGEGRGPLALESVTHRPAHIVHHPSSSPKSPPSSNAQPHQKGMRLSPGQGQIRNMHRLLDAAPVKTEVSCADAWMGPASSTLCREGVRPSTCR